MPPAIRQFFIRSLVATLLGSVIIVLLAPHLGLKTTPAPLEPLVTVIDESPALAGLAGWIRQHLKVSWGAPSPEPDRTAAATEKPSTPSPSRRLATTAQWAIINKSETPIYSGTGKFLERIQAGRIVIIESLKDATSGRVAVCTDWPNPSSPAFVVSIDNLDIQPGSPNDISLRERGLRIDLAKTTAELEALAKAKAKGDDSNNPHAEAYRQAKAEYNDYWVRVKRLTKQRNDNSSTVRERAIDELRQLKGEDIRVGKAYEAARERYQAWQQSQTPTDQSPRVQELETRLARIRNDLDSIDASR
ncbi:MAG: hypothetical protein O3A51_13795 [Verrucomicrobia bacterium]|nr:hypothetical protein [Verrucomicrobiota bacterium]